MYNEYYTHVLMHHGIKGQKWGIRRYQNSNGSYTSAGKVRRGLSNRTKKNINNFVKRNKKKIIAGAGLVASGLAIYGGYKMYRKAGQHSSGYRTYGYYKKPLKDFIDDYSPQGASLKTGTKLQRVSSEAMEDLKAKGHLYCSYLFRDNQRYKSGFRKEINFSGKRDFIHTIVAKHDLKIASPKTCAKTYSSLFPNATDREFWMICDPYAFGNGYDIEDEADRRLDDKIRNRRQTLIEELSNQGYSGIVDMEDAVKRKGSQPLILFNPDEHVDISGSRRIGSFETFVADKLK